MPQTLEEFCQKDSLLSQFSPQEISALKPHFATLQQIHAMPMRAIAVCSYLNGSPSNLYGRDSQVFTHLGGVQSLRRKEDSQDFVALGVDSQNPATLGADSQNPATPNIDSQNSAISDTDSQNLVLLSEAKYPNHNQDSQIPPSALNPAPTQHGTNLQRPITLSADSQNPATPNTDSQNSAISDTDSKNLVLLSEAKYPPSNSKQDSSLATQEGHNTDSQPSLSTQAANTTHDNTTQNNESQSNPYTTLMQQEALHLFFPCNTNEAQSLGESHRAALQSLIFALKPWRKGPFCFHFVPQDSAFSCDAQKKQDSQKLEIPKGMQDSDTKECKIPPFFLDSEWQSNTKMKLILQTLQKIGYELQGKNVLDVGCNNGYYMFDLALRGVAHITGIDPIAPFFLQFYCIAKLSCLPNCSYRLLGVQDIAKLRAQYDLILCLGVLYHRKEPLETLKQLKSALQPNGILILETLIIESEQEICLCPYPTYAKMPNVYYIFSPKALQNLAYHAGFKTCELLSFSYTDNTEQRTTEFIHSQSLGDFLSHTQTIEGYPPACRGIFVLSR